jgi:hypothetical protein
LQKVWDIAKGNLTTDDIKYNLLLATNSEGNTAWRIAAGEWGGENAFKKIWSFAVNVLTIEELEVISNSLRP